MSAASSLSPPAYSAIPDDGEVDTGAAAGASAADAPPPYVPLAALQLPPLSLDDGGPDAAAGPAAPPPPRIQHAAQRARFLSARFRNGMRANPLPAGAGVEAVARSSAAFMYGAYTDMVLHTLHGEAKHMTEEQHQELVDKLSDSMYLQRSSVRRRLYKDSVPERGGGLCVACSCVHALCVCPEPKGYDDQHCRACDDALRALTESKEPHPACACNARFFGHTRQQHEDSDLMKSVTAKLYAPELVYMSTLVCAWIAKHHPQNPVEIAELFIACGNLQPFEGAMPVAAPAPVPVVVAPVAAPVAVPVRQKRRAAAIEEAVAAASAVRHSKRKPVARKFYHDEF